MGTDPQGGYVVKLRDGFGNTYRYGGLAKLATAYPVPKDETVSKKDVTDELGLSAAKDKAPALPASAGSQAKPAADAPADTPAADAAPTADAPTATDAAGSGKERVFAHPRRSNVYRNGGREQILAGSDGVTSFKSYFTEIYGLNRKDVTLKELKPGAKVIAGTILGRLQVAPKGDAHVAFRSGPPAPRASTQADPRRLETAGVHRHLPRGGRNALVGGDGRTPASARSCS